MTVYNRNSPADDTTISATYLDGELSAIESAVNDIDDNNISAGAIGNSKLANPKAYFALHLKAGSVAGGAAIASDRQDVTVVPVTATLVAVRVSCTAKDDGGGTEPDVDVYLEGGTPASILNSAIDLAAALTAYTGSISTSSFSAGDVLTLRATTDATGGITDLDVVLLFKTNHVA